MLQWAKSNFVPCIAVQSTPAADAICQKNSMTYAQLFEPFAFVPDINIPVRVNSERSVNVSDMRVRFVMLSEVEAKKREPIFAALDSAVTAHAPRDPKPWNFTHPLDAQGYLHSAAAKSDMTPWFSAFTEKLIEMLRGGDCETMDYPLAVFNIVSAGESNVLGVLNSLTALPNMPSVFAYGLADPKILRFQVIVHDNSDPTHTLETTERIFSDIKRTFGTTGCRVLRINSSPSPSPLCSPWANFPNNNNNNQQQNNFLSVGDAKNVSETVSSFVRERLVRFVEDRILRVGEQVQARKGIKNQLKNWWKRGNQHQDDSLQDPAPRAREGFGHDTPLGQQRILADLLLLIGDYENASSQYKHAAEDFKGEKALRHFASAMEMFAVCTAVTATLKPAQYATVTAQVAMKVKLMKDVDSALEQAYVAHLRSASNANDGLNQLYALRVLVFVLVLNGLPLPRYNIAVPSAVLDRQKCIKRHIEIAQLLLRSSVDLDSLELVVALIVEQAALCYLFAPSSHIRKFAFHLILSGYRYSRCQQRAHAIRCYSSCVLVYGQGWLSAHDHMHYTLARLHWAVGNVQAALELFIDFLKDCQQSPDKQEKALQTFAQCYVAWSNQQPSSNAPRMLGVGPEASPLLTMLCGDSVDVQKILKIQLPIVNDQKLTVAFGDEQQDTASGANDDADMPWQAIEACACALVHHDDKQQHLTAQQLQQQQQQQFRIGSVFSSGNAFSSFAQAKRARAVAQEPVVVAFNLANPLACQLNVANMMLVCEMQRDEEPPSSPVPITFEVCENITLKDVDNGTHSVQVVSFTMAPKQSKDITLCVVPRVRGKLNIVGVVWSLVATQATVHAFHPFETKGKRLNSTRDQRVRVVHDTAPNRDITVLSAMARLSVRMTPLPQTMLQGEIFRVDVSVTNKGSDTLDKLRLFSTHSPFIQLGAVNTDTPRNSGGPEPVKTTTNSVCVTFDRSSVRVCNISDPNGVRYLPFSLGCLQPHETVCFPMWLRCPRDGQFTSKILFYYKPHSLPANKNPQQMQMEQRFVRVCWRVNVLPLLSAKPALYRVEGEAENHLMALQVHNASATNELTLDGVCVVGSQWKLRECETTPSAPLRLFARQSLLRVVRLTRRAAEDTQRVWCVGTTPVEAMPLPVERFLSSDKEAGGLVVASPGGSAADAAKRSSQAKSGGANNGASSNVDVVVMWSCGRGDNTRRGQLNLPGVVVVADPTLQGALSTVTPKRDRLQPASPTSPRKQPKQDQAGAKSTNDAPLAAKPRASLVPQLHQDAKATCHALHLSFGPSTRLHVTHQFTATKKACIVPLTLHVINSAPQTTLGVQIELHDASSSTQSAVADPNVSLRVGPCDMMWIGTTRKNLGDLSAGASVEIPLQACFFAPGLFHINHVTVTVGSANAVPCLLKAECHALVNIVDPGRA